MNKTPMMEVLEQCSILELQIILVNLLPREGFGDPEVLDRLRSSQKTRHGGFEMICRRTTSFLQQTTLVKVVNDNVRQRMVCEMAGQVDLNGADWGLIVTPRKVCKSAREALHVIARSKVHVIDGRGLERLLRKHRIGIRRDDSVDYELFLELYQFASLLEPGERIPWMN